MTNDRVAGDSVTDGTVSRDEVAAFLATKQELGPDYDSALADALVERLERTVDARVAERLAEARERTPQRGQDMRIAGLRFAMAVVSMVVAVPLTFIVAGAADAVTAVGMLWLGIVAVNTIFVLATRR